MIKYPGLVPTRFLFMIQLQNQQLNETGLMGFPANLGNCHYILYIISIRSKLTFRFICNKNIENDGNSCPDYEIRFCCPQNLSQNTSAIKSLSYSESDFNQGDLAIR